MPTQVKIAQFEGPLDLLLQLIEREELTITEVALARVTAQFLEHLKGVEEKRPEELADFLVVGSRLVYLKSRELLPVLAPDEADSASLAEQLRLYQVYAAASQTVLRLWEREYIGYAHLEPRQPPRQVQVPINVTVSTLRNHLLMLLERLKPREPLPEVAIDRGVSLRERVESIWQWLKEWPQMRWRHLLARARSKTDLIVNFLAVLELVKREQVVITQSKAFGDIEIKRA